MKRLQLAGKLYFYILTLTDRDKKCRLGMTVLRERKLNRIEKRSPKVHFESFSYAVNRGAVYIRTYQRKRLDRISGKATYREAGMPPAVVADGHNQGQN